ncbi:MAG: hypothetical protein H6754_08935 [Candidatus Omnitrophica bacterium]|nr:hypothetical protein [Candidatus Omnitrophota bacterium]
MSSPLEIKSINSVSMTLSDGSVWQFLIGKPSGWEAGDEVKVKSNNDPAPGGPKRFQVASLMQATNVTKNIGPISVTSAGSINPPSQSAPKKSSYAVEDIKLGTKYAILDTFPDEDSFLLECGLFMIDRLMIPPRQKVEWSKGDTVILHPSATTRGKTNKFMVENLNHNSQKIGVLFIAETK